MNISYYLKYYLRVRPIFMSLIRAKEAALFEHYAKYIKGPAIDVGCGDGEFAKMVWGSVDTGIDLSGSRIDEANKLNVYKKTLLFNGIKIPVKKNSYRTAISNCVLEHVDDLEGLLKGVKMAIRPRGYFLTTVMAKPWENYLLGGKLFGNTYKLWFRRTQEHKNLLTEAQWDEAFNKSGWTIVEKVGYLSPEASRWIEFCHYLSIGYLISYKLTGKWTWWNPAPILPISLMTKLMEENVTPDKSGAIFYVLKKNN